MINGLPRILIVRLSSIGDVVRVLPALHTLRQIFPDAQIDWAVERKSAAIIEDHPSLDRVLVFDRPSGFSRSIASFLHFIREVRRGRYDIVVDFHGILKSGLITGYSGAAQRLGFSPPRAQELSYFSYNRRVGLSARDLNRVEENLLLCDELAHGQRSSDMTIHVAHDVQDEVNAFFEEAFEGAKRIIAMHVPVDRPEKQWPLAHFAELADLLLADGRFEVMLTWGPGQLELVEEVRRKARRNPLIAPETTDLKHYAWMIYRSDLYFGGDTGPMHIAAAMGTPVVAVFGGTDPAKHAPYKRPCEILANNDPSLTPAQRMERITPEMAYDACVKMLSK